MENEKIRSYSVPDELRSLIPGYMGRRDQDITEMKGLVHNGDLEAIARIAHKLKGNGASYGFDRLTEIGEQLMRACASHNSNDVSKLIAELEEEVHAIKQTLL